MQSLELRANIMERTYNSFGTPDRQVDEIHTLGDYLTIFVTNAQHLIFGSPDHNLHTRFIVDKLKLQ